MKDAKKKGSENKGVTAPQAKAITDSLIKANSLWAGGFLMFFTIYLSSADAREGITLLPYRARLLIASIPLLAFIWEFKKYHDMDLFSLTHIFSIKKNPKNELTEAPNESKQTVIPLNNRSAAFRQMQAAHRQANKSTKKTPNIYSRLYSKFLSLISDCFSGSKKNHNSALQDQILDKRESSENNSDRAKETNKNKTRHQRRKINFSKQAVPLNIERTSPLQAAENMDSQQSISTRVLSSTRTILTETSSAHDTSASESESEIKKYISIPKSETHLALLKPAQPASASSNEISITPSLLEKKENSHDAILQQVQDDLTHIKKTIDSFKQNVSINPNYATYTSISEEKKASTNIELQLAVKALELKYELLQKQIADPKSFQQNDSVENKSNSPSVMNEQNQAENADFTNTVSQLVLSTRHLVTMMNDIAPLEIHRRYGGQTQADHISFLGNKIIEHMNKPQFKSTNNVLPPSQVPTRTMF